MKNRENIMQLNQTHALAGMLALVTMIHHISVSPISESLYGNMFVSFKNVGVFCVGFFMFMFGYDLIYHIQVEEQSNREGVSGSILKTKLFPLLITFFICNYAYMIVTQLLGEHYEMKQLLSAIFGLLLLNNQMWIAIEVIWIYLAASIVYKITKKSQKTIALLCVLIVAIMVGSFVVRISDFSNDITNWLYGEWWFNTLPCFILGMVYSVRQEIIHAKVETKKIPVFIVLLILSAVGVYLTIDTIARHGYWTDEVYDIHIGDKLITACVQLPTVCIVTALLVFLVVNIKFRFKPLELSGKVYLELILLNNIFIYVCSKKEFELGRISFVVLELVFTYCCAWIMHYIRNVALGKRREKGNEK